MKKHVLVIGGHGMLGRPVVRRLVSEGFGVRAMARSVEKAQKLLPTSVEVVQGDLEDVESIRQAAESMDVVYMNLSTPDPSAAFQQDVDGPKNVIQALSGNDKKNVVLVKIADHPLVDTQGWWPNSDLKLQAEEVIRQSGHPYLFFHPTWFMESLPLFKTGNTATLLGRQWNPLYFIAGDDYGRMVAAALQQEDLSFYNRTFVVQGLEALDFQQALERFAAELDNQHDLCVIHVPMFVPALLACFVPMVKDVHRLFTVAQREKEEFVSQNTWEELVKPKMIIEDYVHYMQETGDVPKKD